MATAFLVACAVSEERHGPAAQTGFHVPALGLAAIKADDRRRSVAFETREQAGTVVVDMAAGSLYLVTGEGRAMRYRIEPLAPKSAKNAPSRARNWAIGGQQPAPGAMIRMINPEDARDLHQRMSAGGKVVFLPPTK